ncbi:MAG: MFS transporter [Sphingomonas sp.]
MTDSKIDIDRLVDGQKFRRFNFSLLFWCFLATFADGFEVTSIGLAAPEIAREWNVAPALMGPMLSASLFGMLIGAPLFGFLGDRHGRRLAITLGCLVFGITTLAVTMAQDTGQISVLRFLTGIGMGGVMPNAIALTSESSPKRLRARLIILMFMGITLGGTVPGAVSAWLVPEYGWKTIFLIGGVVGIAVGLCAPFALPESVKFLGLNPARRTELIRTLARMRPDLTFREDAEVVAPGSTRPAARSSLAPLFSNGLASTTLLLWVCFAITLMANYFLTSWLPMLFERQGITPQTAALTATMFHFGAIFGALAMSVLLDRIGFLAIGGMLLAAVPAVLLIGVSGLSPIALGLIVAFAGFCVIGAQLGNNASAGLIYPTVCRSKGIGVAFAVGRAGSVLGPIFGAQLIGLGLPITTTLLALAGPLLVGAIAAFVLARLSYARFHSWKLDEGRLFRRGMIRRIACCRHDERATLDFTCNF